MPAVSLAAEILHRIAEQSRTQPPRSWMIWLLMHPPTSLEKRGKDAERNERDEQRKRRKTNARTC